MKMKTNKPDIIIAIDPDTDKIGFAALKTAERKLETSSMTYVKLIRYLGDIWAEVLHHNTMVDLGMTEKPINIVVIVEAGWLNASNWHITKSDNQRLSSKKGYDVGRNHEVGRKIIEMARDYFGFEVIEQKPLRKMWRGKDGKITHDELAYFTGIAGRTSQDCRDAALLAWYYAGFPIKSKPI
jgi:hypothetical protein